ncbi:MAG: ABC transporter permease [Ktedonobacterales bacterium]
MFTGTILRGVRNVLRSPLRLVLVVAILGTCLMFVAVMFVLNGSAQQRLSAAQGQVGSGIDVRAPGSFGPFGGGTLTASQVKTITSTAGVGSVTEVLSERYTGTAIKGNVSEPSGGFGGGGGGFGGGGGGGFGGGGFSSDNGTVAPSIYGMQPGQSSYDLATGSVATVSSGRNLKTSETTADVALMSKALASANGLKVGSTFTLDSTKLTLVGLFTTGSTFGDDTLILPLQTMQKVYDVSGVSTVTVYPTDTSGVNALVTKLKSELGSGVDVVSQATLYQDTLNALSATQGTIFTTLIVAIVTAALVIVFAVMMIVRERVQEIGLLKAIGASHWQVVSQFGVEVLSLSGIAAVVALLLLVLVGNSLASKFDLTSPGGGGFGGGRFGGGAFIINSSSAAATTPFSAGLSFGSLLLVLGIGILLALVATVIPAWYVARIKPADVLRAE